MTLNRIHLTDFRTYADETVSLAEGVNCLVGPNGVGKTNLIEAAYYVSTLSSHRVASTTPMVRSGAEQAVISADIGHDGRETHVDVTVAPGRAVRLRVAGTQARAKDFIGCLRTVLFAPEDLSIIKGDPETRRRFIDQLLVQRAPRYHSVISDFERIVRQRTALLRSMSGRRALDREPIWNETLEVWDGQLIESAAQLLRGRQMLISELSGPSERAYSAIAPGSTLGVSYHPRSLGHEVDRLAMPTDLGDIELVLASAMAERRKDEVARGQTLVGPHRDDILVEINGMAARGYASHGESWSAALALRIASFEVLRTLETREREPVLLLDDVFAELDEGRREHLAEVVRGARQTIVTVAVPADIPRGLDGTRFDVTQGSVRRSGDKVVS